MKSDFGGIHMTAAKDPWGLWIQGKLVFGRKSKCISFWNSSSTYLLTSSRAWEVDFFRWWAGTQLFKGERFLSQQELPLFLEDNNGTASHTWLWWRRADLLCQSSVPFHPKQHRLWLLGSPVQGQELRSVILLGPSQFRWFCSSVNCFVSLCSVPVNLFLLYQLKKSKPAPRIGHFNQRTFCLTSPW